MKTTWSKLVSEMTIGLDEDAAAAVVAGALSLVCCLSHPTEAEQRFALAFARDRVISLRA
jgi:hypothetical protein